MIDYLCSCVQVKKLKVLGGKQKPKTIEQIYLQLRKKSKHRRTITRQTNKGKKGVRQNTKSTTAKGHKPKK